MPEVPFQLLEGEEAEGEEAAEPWGVEGEGEGGVELSLPEWVVVQPYLEALEVEEGEGEEEQHRRMEEEEGGAERHRWMESVVGVGTPHT